MLVKLDEIGFRYDIPKASFLQAYVTFTNVEANFLYSRCLIAIVNLKHDIGLYFLVSFVGEFIATLDELNRHVWLLLIECDY